MISLMDKGTEDYRQVRLSKTDKPIRLILINQNPFVTIRGKENSGVLMNPERHSSVSGRSVENSDSIEYTVLLR